MHKLSKASLVWLLVGVFSCILLAVGKFYFAAKGLSADNPRLTISGAEYSFALLMWSFGPIGFNVLGFATAHFGMIGFERIIDRLLDRNTQ